MPLKEYIPESIKVPSGSQYGDVGIINRNNEFIPEIKKESPTKRKKDLPFKVKKYLTRNMSGCKTATGYTSKEIYEMLGWE